MSNMDLHKNEQGIANPLLIPLILSATFLLFSLGFGVWAFTSQQDYKNNSDKKAEKAASVAVKKAETAKDNEFVEKEKEPYRDYKGLASLGSIAFKYPKTWSISQKDSDSELSLIAHPLVISTNEKSLYALRVEVVGQAYSGLARQQDGNVKKGTVKATPYALPKIPNVVGIRFDGQLTQDKKGSVILLPMRDKTIRISTENPDFRGDLDKIILADFTYSP